ncbi:DUF2520 domain-containing protein [Actinospongicola halichondriae]|uniref:DUF2520 domain-containing protein n=1 Tax=Actinospongicola halichondriae TaxID=3236844 RepID=UPI003D5437CE
MQSLDARVIGAGRAGGAFTAALTAAGWSVDGPLGRTDDVSGAAAGVDVLLLAVPDDVVASLAAEVAPGDAAVMHVAGSLGLDVLAPHDRVASVHPLVSLADAALGAERLRGAWFATAGDEATTAAVVDALDGRRVEVADADRVAYHAAAAIAANHLVALLGQAERVAAAVGVPLEAYLDLARGALDNVEAVGPQAALTGPVARDDWATVARHVEALPIDERAAYSVLADAARRLRDGATA